VPPALARFHAPPLCAFPAKDRININSLTGAVAKLEWDPVRRSAPIRRRCPARLSVGRAYLGWFPHPGNGLPRRARGLRRGPKAALSGLRACLGGCSTPTITVSLRFRVGIRAARDTFAMDILLDNRVAFPIDLPVDSDFAVIPVRARINGRRGCRASARNGNRRRGGNHHHARRWGRRGRVELRGSCARDQHGGHRAQ
jgi:hypothetical protein